MRNRFFSPQKNKPSATMRLLLPLTLPCLLLCMLPTACIETSKPLDADTRRLIDSLSAAGISLARNNIDSTCKTDRVTLLPVLVDSIRKVREREIREKLKNIGR